MNKGINLLGAEGRRAVKVISRKLQLLRLTALGLLFGISGLSIILFLLIALSPLPALQRQEKEALTTLSQYHPDMAQLYLIDDRVKGSETILSKRTDFDTVLSEIRTRLPTDANVSALSMSKQEISVTVTSGSLASLDTFLNNLISATEEGKTFSKVVLTKFFTNEENSTFNVTVNISI